MDWKWKKYGLKVREVGWQSALWGRVWKMDWKSEIRIESQKSRLKVSNVGRIVKWQWQWLFYSTIDIQIEIIMYNSLENQIINWSGDYY